MDLESLHRPQPALVLQSTPTPPSLHLSISLHLLHLLTDIRNEENRDKRINASVRRAESTDVAAPVLASSDTEQGKERERKRAEGALAFGMIPEMIDRKHLKNSKHMGQYDNEMSGEKTKHRGRYRYQMSKEIYRYRNQMSREISHARTHARLEKYLCFVLPIPQSNA